MNAIIDTHVLIWALIKPRRLSAHAMRLLTDINTGIIVSSASIWELGIKYHGGKMPEMARIFPRIEYYLARLRVRELRISHTHALMASSLPMVHRDPFDRMLVAQAIVEGIPLVTDDKLLERYSVLTIW
ncbi:MAG: type II toxin-antitoxin system VapC family toxin [Chloroflexi bacterium]|nr:type II toxin-antitoxin system VapC family toxin [Chloroflexota bacterium]